MISLRGPKLRIIALIVAAAAFLAGVYLSFFHSRGFVKSTAVIVALEETTDAEDNTSYIPTVEYVVDGRTYTGKLDQSDGSYRVGKTITVLYDPRDPTVVHGGRGIGYYLMILGAAIIGIIIVTAVREKQSLQKAQALREASGLQGYAPSQEGAERELYFLTDLGTPKYGHRIEDGERRVLYEAKMTKFTLTQPFEFDFIDHEHGTSAPHLVGHQEESRWGSLLVDNHYTFELDGVDIWEHLKQHGVSIDTNYAAGSGRVIGMDYRILRDGREIGRAESASQYPHEEDAERHRIAGALPAAGFYRLWTREQNLDLLFATLLAFARSGAGDGKGGNYGALIGTLKNMGKNR